VTWRDAVVVAGRGVRRRAGRAVLTVLAVALAATLLTSLLIASGAARRRVLNQVTSGGPLTGIEVSAAAASPGALDSDQGQPGAPRAITEAARQRIARLPHVRSVAPVVATPVLIVPPLQPVNNHAAGASSTSRSTATTNPANGRRRNVLSGSAAEPFAETLIGADLSHAGDLPISLLAGRLPKAGALDEVAVTLGYLRRFGLERPQANEVVGTEMVIGAPRLFASVGQGQVRGRWTREQIVGVVAQQAGGGDVLAPIQQAQLARDWTRLGDDANQFGIDASPYTALFVVADDLGRVSDVRAEITRVGFNTSAPESLIETVQHYVRVVEIVLAGIGFIALFIAALGITNAMLAAVRERRREIGVLKAIGARDRDVRRVFLLEAGTLGFIGGLVGSVLGYVLARTLASVVNNYLAHAHLEGVHFGLPVAVLGGAVLGATVLALIAGTLPAQRAAMLPARQAMGDR
jgi:cell division protein FtsX